ncbi:hypothetical protein O9H85_18585 [Paenibacillus filicis]|uniref:Uncharacterized protein n=1 Tax=Paenibacillus gyeongsangnamensis TaxID=3388067 RepID=A0ABT4QBX2_9BACL|nr:hypothetical protein [Paenibacillus filicis]MCZ8514392.1 hypothetical protein [Paenibacillus filicis]
MDPFLKALNEVIQSWAELSKEWELIEPDYSDELSEGYPFNKDFNEIVHELIE